MKRIRGARLALTAAVACGALTLAMTSSFAGKPGGGSTPPPTGKIYFRDQASGEQTWPYILLYSMDGSGANRALVTQTHADARASRQLHGGQRWLLTLEDVAGGPGYAGSVRRELFAVREDGALHVQLTSQPTMQFWRLDWAPDEGTGGATISMLGRQWTGTTSTDTVVPGTVGLYTAHLTFDGSGNVVGLDAPPAFTVSLGTYVSGMSPPLPDVFTYSWSPDMTRVVADNRDRLQIRVVTVSSGAVLALGPGSFPDWSPDGIRIGYSRFIPASSARARDMSTLETVRPDGTDVRTVLSMRATNGLIWWPRWSPGGAHFAYTLAPNYNTTINSNYVYRIAVDGSGNTNLTPDSAPGGAGYGFILTDWR